MRTNHHICLRGDRGAGLGWVWLPYPEIAYLLDTPPPLYPNPSPQDILPPSYPTAQKGDEGRPWSWKGSGTGDTLPPVDRYL